MADDRGEREEQPSRLSRQILHNGDDRSLDSESTLIKLHGDLGHVLTMAIAGEDKMFLSRLASFAPLYLAAQACLEKRARGAASITWHIVGHGLRDELLLRVIEKVYRAAPRKHRFIVIDPAKGGDKPKRLDEHPAYRLLKESSAVIGFGHIPMLGARRQVCISPGSRDRVLRPSKASFSIWIDLRVG